MFCKNCGKEVAEGVRFCTSCGAKISGVAENTTGKTPTGNSPSAETDTANTNTAQETTDGTQSRAAVTLDETIKITGKRAGEESFFYAALLLFLLLFSVGTWISWIIFFGLAVYAYLKIPRTISYNSLQKKFIANEKSRLSAFRKSVEIPEIMAVRVRKVKLLFSFRHSLSVPGEYFVIAFDTKLQGKNLNVWFAKEDEMRKFLAIAASALNENGKNITIDEDLSLIKAKEFYEQCRSERESVSVGGFIKKHVWKAVATFVILLIIGGANLASGSGIDAGLDKFESAITKMEKFEKKAYSSNMTAGQIMAETQKIVKEIEDAADLLSIYDESDFTAEQWDRMLELTQRMYELSNKNYYY